MNVFLNHQGVLLGVSALELPRAASEDRLPKNWAYLPGGHRADGSPVQAEEIAKGQLFDTKTPPLEEKSCR